MMAAQSAAVPVVESVEHNRTRSAEKVWLIGYPLETIMGARLPSGHDVMRNFVFYHRSKKLTINASTQEVFAQVMPFWEKSRIPTRQKHHIVQKIKQLYSEYSGLMKHRSRSNPTDRLNQDKYTKKLDTLFDISHARAEQMIKIDEDREFLRLQRMARVGAMTSVDKKLAAKEKRSAERHKRLKQRQQASKSEASAAATTVARVDAIEPADSSDGEELDDETDADFHSPSAKAVATSVQPKRQHIISPTVSAVLDRTNTSIRKSAMILASVVNEAGPSTSSVVLSRSTVHRRRQLFRKESADKIKANYCPAKSTVHWDGKLLPDVTGSGDDQIDRLPVLITSLDDRSTKLLGVPKLPSGSGKAAADAVFQELVSWECLPDVIGMCFDTTASNTGRLSGACTLLEQSLGRDVLWLACRHHMFEVLLANAFNECFGPTTGPEILLFKRFKDCWSSLIHQQLSLDDVAKLQKTPKIAASDSLKAFISQQLGETHAREDYKELLNLAGLLLGLAITATVRKPGALHRARWMAKAIYSMKIELLYDGNEIVLNLTGQQLQSIKRFNRFIVNVYVQSWFTARSASDAPVNDIQLIRRLQSYDDDKLRNIGLRMMARHSWYLSPETASLALFSDLLSVREKSGLMSNMSATRGPHLLKTVPSSTAELRMSRSFFSTTGIDDSFLDIPVDEWPHDSYQNAVVIIRNLPCVNDVAERGVALIQTFNTTTKDEAQKQYLLQVVEQHRKKFSSCNRDSLMNI